MEIDIDELKNVRNSSNNLKSKEDNDNLILINWSLCLSN